MRRARRGVNAAGSGGARYPMSVQPAVSDRSWPQEESSAWKRPRPVSASLPGRHLRRAQPRAGDPERRLPVAWDGCVPQETSSAWMVPRPVSASIPGSQTWRANRSRVRRAASPGRERGASAELAAPPAAAAGGAGGEGGGAARGGRGEVEGVVGEDRVDAGGDEGVPVVPAVDGVGGHG